MQLSHAVIRLFDQSIDALVDEACFVVEKYSLDE